MSLPVENLLQINLSHFVLTLNRVDFYARKTLLANIGRPKYKKHFLHTWKLLADKDLSMSAAAFNTTSTLIRLQAISQVHRESWDNRATIFIFGLVFSNLGYPNSADDL
ncbi:hypothetical protein TNCV_227371 [Trichonephila clavipes]|nr:hypothetical protein TNCV_227371 [Trichonephila clavipes]